MRRPRPSEVAWGVLAGSVVAYEALCPEDELLTNQADRWRESVAGKLAVHALAWTVAGHLTRTIPPQYDWLHRVSAYFGRDRHAGIDVE